MSRYDPRSIADAYDTYGEQEWERHETTAFRRVAFHVHRHYLEQFIQPGNRVLEAGSGAGRFTVELARLGARVTVTDISPEQLRLNEQHVSDAELAESIEERAIADIVDLSRFADGTFDVVVCYGGPLSYVMDRADVALAELLRVVKPRGIVLVGVMSNLGSLRAFLPGVDQDIKRSGIEAMQRVFDSGDLPDELSSLGPMHMFTWNDLQDLLGRHPCELVVASAANFFSVRNDEVCETWLEDPEMWDRFLTWEVEACRQPGALDAGTHIVAVIRSSGRPARRET